MKKIFTLTICAFFLAGCLQLDPVSENEDIPVIRLREGDQSTTILRVLDIDPGESVTVSLHSGENSTTRIGGTASSSTATVRVSSSGMNFVVRGIQASGMGIIKFESDDGGTADLRVFVRNWRKDEVYRHGLYGDMEIGNTEYVFDPNEEYHYETNPYRNKLAVYRYIVDSGFHYEAPDGLSRRITNQFPDSVHADIPRELIGVREIHPVPHIIPVNDYDYFREEWISGFFLRKNVFKFIMHIHDDGDMVGGYADRQRLEIKTMDNTEPPGATDSQDRMFSNGGGDTFTHRWKFRLPDNFLVSSEYTHIHQIKPEGGDSGNPTFTLTGRKLRTGREVLQLIYRGPIRDNDDPSVNWYPCQVDLQPFKGEWIHAEETVTYDNPGTYRIRLTRIRDMKVLMEYIYSPEQYDEPDPFAMFRPGNIYIRPKFGLYRRILHMTPFGLPDMEDPVTEYWAENNDQGVVVLYADIEMDKLKR